MHLAHRVFLIMRPFSMIETFCKFGLNVRLVACWENDRLWPKVVALPQVLHFMLVVLSYNDSGVKTSFQRHEILPYNATIFKIYC